MSHLSTVAFAGLSVIPLTPAQMWREEARNFRKMNIRYSFLDREYSFEYDCLNIEDMKAAHRLLKELQLNQVHTNISLTGGPFMDNAQLGACLMALGRVILSHDLTIRDALGIYSHLFITYLRDNGWNGSDEEGRHLAKMLRDMLLLPE